MEASLLKQIGEDHLDFHKYKPNSILQWYNQLSPSIRLEETQDQEIQQYLLQTEHVRHLLRRLRSPFSIRRIEAVSQLRNLIGTQEIRTAFLEALTRESREVVTLYLFEALARAKEKRAIIPMLRKLGKATPWMAGRYRALLISYAEKLLPYLESRLKNNRLYLKLLITEYAAQYPCEELKNYLIKQAHGKNSRIRVKALHALSINYPQVLTEESFSHSRFKETPIYVIRAYAALMDPANIPMILSYARRPPLQEQIVQSLSEMTGRNPAILSALLAQFEIERRVQIRSILARVLNNRIAYLLESNEGQFDANLISLLERLVKDRYISGLVQYLNTGSDENTQTQILALLSKLAKKNRSLRLLLFTYLHPSLYEKLSLPTPKIKPPPAKPHMEKPQRVRLILLLVLVLTVLPLLIFIKELPNLVGLPFAQIWKLYIVRFNYLLIYYSLSINLIYLFILAISFRTAKVQHRLWNAKDTQLLFTKGVLPSVSIIAPAFNEEANIIESTNSLLNQHYPNFELIVVNDGSKDKTLQTLIDYFDLDKQDRIVPERLHTKPLRGIYTNKNIPNLVVVDKVNGGKADSLNLGLDVAVKEFFCGIDADSLLEPDALLKAVSVMLDTRIESIATGGNICPVNGCSVELGSLDSIALPSKFLARLQSLEYMRSFMTGRIGWARLNLLLVISGAFGVFDRERTIATGGYLTKSGKYHKDTVGEDMELVVRLSRYMREHKRPYRVQYAGNANCWTEVPESWKVLKRQRDRWQRGLIDIMLFHSTMIANPRYGSLGMVAMTYYFIFELVGPFIEAQGLILVFISAFVGLLNVPIVMALFAATVLMGIMVSLSSLYISDYDRSLYSFKDIIRLLGMTIIENFGVRQVISLLRIKAYFNAMRKGRGWGAQVRKGFKTAPSQTQTK